MPSTTYIDESLIQALSASADVSLQAGSRIYSVQAPQGTAFPCVVLARNSQSRSLSSDLLATGGLVRATYLISAVSDELLEVRNLSRAIRAALEYTRTTAIRLAVVRDEDEQQEPSPGGEQLPLYRTDLTVEVTYIDT